MDRRWMLVGALSAHSACGRFNFEARDDAQPEDPRCRAAAVAVGHGHTCAIDLEGQVWCWGWNELGQSAPVRPEANLLTAVMVPLPMPATQLGAGRDNTCALLSDASLWCWGNNSSGELGQGHTMPSSAPLRAPTTAPVTSFAVGAATICMVAKPERTVQCWGENKNDDLGIPRATPFSSTPVTVAGTAGTARVIFGHRHACAIRDDGVVACWGRGSNGQLGNGAEASGPSPVVVAGLDEAVSSVALAARNSCVLEQSGTVRCFGRNEENVLATGDYVDGNTAGGVIVSNAVDVQVGRYGACARHADGTLDCWGVVNQFRGPAPLPERFPLAGVTQVAMKYKHSCAIANGHLRCWGRDIEAQLGRGERDIATSPVVVPFSSATHVAGSHNRVCATTGTTVACWGGSHTGDGTNASAARPVIIDTGLSSIGGISLSSNTTCVWGGGASRCWGRNHFAQVGTGAATVEELSPRTNSVPNVTRIVTGAFSTYAVTTSAFLSWGRNESGQLGNGATMVSSATPMPVTGITQPSDVAAGSTHACAIEAGALRCWGSNQDGEIGDGTTADRPLPTIVALVNVTNVAAGARHTCALVAGGSLYCWGGNLTGQLGVGDRVDRTTPTLVPLANVTAIFAHEYNTCAVTGAGEAYCWGGNPVGEVANGTAGPQALLPTRITALDGADEIVAGVCAVKAGSVACWGPRIRLADGDESRSVPMAPTVYCNR